MTNQELIKQWIDKRDNYFLIAENYKNKGDLRNFARYNSKAIATRDCINDLVSIGQKCNVFIADYQGKSTSSASRCIVCGQDRINHN